MEDFLKDSPFEESTQAPRFGRYENYEDNPTNDFSLDLTNQRSNDYNNYNDDLTNNYNDYNNDYNNEYASPSGYQSPNNFQSPQNFKSSNYQSPNTFNSPLPGNDSNNNLNPVSSNDPYYGTFEFMQPASPNQQPQQPVGADIPGLPGDFNSKYSDPLQFNMNETYNNLDSLVSPDNNAGSQPLDMFSTAQYFSPNSRQNHFNNLYAIAEDSLPGSFENNVFTPNISRHGSVSMPPSNNENYLSPHSTAFLSPQSRPYDGSYDPKLKSPYAGSTQMNSPPPPLNLNLSKSIPSAVNFNQPSFRNQKASIEDALSPPQQNPHSLGTSAPSSSKKPESFSTSKTMSQEEKVKRRREFHNAVERRRRDLIKEKIKELGFLVPPSLLNPQVSAVQVLSRPPHSDSPEIKELLSLVKVKESKPNKAAILSCSVDYIRHLKKVAVKQNSRRSDIEQEIAELESQLGGLKTEDQPAPRYNNNMDYQRQQPQGQSSDFNPDDFFSDVINDPNQY